MIDDIVNESKKLSFDIESRMIVQLYTKNDYYFIQKYEFKELWYTNYKSNMSCQEINNFFDDKDDVTTIVIYIKDWILRSPFNTFPSKKTAVHTVDDPSILKFLFSHNVDYAYINF